MGNMPFRIVIAEDESVIREDIAEKVASIDPDFCIAGQAQDGEEALRLVGQLHPDALITDIEMPRMGGIELIRMVRKLHPGVHIIILSGFDNFTYAQSAIKYNVIDYLLKPVSVSQLRETLTDICEKVAESAQNRQRSLLLRSIKGEPILLSSELIDSRVPYDIYLVMVGNLPQKDDLLSAPRLCNLDQHHFENICRSALACERELYIFDEGLPNQKYVLAPVCGQDGSARLFDALQRLFSPMPITVCTPGHPVPISELRHYTIELQRLIERSVVPCQSGIYSLKEATVLDFKIHENLLVLRFAKLIGSGDFKQFESEFCMYFADKLLPQRYFEHILAHIVARADSADDRSVSVSAIPLIHQVCSQATHRRIMLRDLCDLIRCEFLAQYSDAARPEDIISRITSYLKENFREPVTTETLSSTFSFNASYLIRLFKKNMGITPTQYIINLRIEEAKRLMAKDPTLTIRQISELCGYTDQHYFSRIFKHVTGLSPSDYRLSKPPAYSKP